MGIWLAFHPPGYLLMMCSLFLCPLLLSVSPRSLPPPQGQYIKAVFPGEPADLAGMLNSDHVLEVDDVDVTEMTHMEVFPYSSGE